MSISVKKISNNEKKKKIVFEVSGTSLALLNSVRRGIIDDVAVLAIEDVEFKKNDSGLYDEVIAHRLGLIPLKTDLSTFTKPEEGVKQEDLGASSKVVLRLKSSASGYVYASEIQCDDSTVKPVYPEMPIVKLDENQEIETEMTAIMGTGREHSKWTPGSVILFNKPELTYKGTLSKDFPKFLLDSNGKVNTSVLYENSQYLDSLEKISEGVVNIKDSEDVYVICLESWGQVSSKDLFIGGIEVLKEKVNSFTQALNSVK